MKGKIPLLQDLLEVGLSEREARIYLVLLERRGASQTDLAKLSGVRQNRMPEVINSLLRMGLCKERRVGRRRFFEVNLPSQSLGPTLRDLESRLQRGRQLADKLDTIYRSLDDPREPLEYIETVHGNDNVYQHFIGILRKTNKEFLSFARPPFAGRPLGKVQEQLDELQKLTQRGGTARWVYELSAMDWTDDAPNPAQLIHDRGYDVRVAAHLPLKMFVFDREIVLLAKESDIVTSGELTMSSIRQGAIAEAFAVLFDFFYQQATNYAEWASKQRR